MALPLSGRCIAVTRPRDQAHSLAQSIEQLGGRVLLFPLLSISPIADTTRLHQQLATLAEFDLAIFISPNAVNYGIAAIRHLGEIPSSLQIAAVGGGTAKSLAKQGFHTVLTPTERFDSEGLLELTELQQMMHKKVIIFRGETGRELLGDTLKARGAQVEYASCYQRNKPEQGIDVLLNAKPDAITVTSSEALNYLSDMLRPYPHILQHTPLFAPHPRIAELARQLGWQQVFQTESGDEGVLVGLQNHFGSPTA